MQIIAVEDECMRILVYGAGVLGCNLAHDLYCAKKDVTILARNAWAENIKQKGLVIKHLLRTTRDRINVVTQLNKEDVYDVIFVVMQYSQIKDVLPILKENKSKTIIFVGNNLKALEYEQELPDKRVLFAFYAACGRREATRVRSMALGKITIGQAKGKCDCEMIEAVFEDSGIKVRKMKDMDSWLKTHAAFILPLAYACYYTNGNLKKLKKEKELLNTLIDAVREGYEVVEEAGFSIVPYDDYEYVTTNRKKCYSYFKMLCGTFIGKMAVSDHAMSAVQEMSVLSADFQEMKKKSGLETPNWDFWENNKGK